MKNFRKFLKYVRNLVIAAIVVATLLSNLPPLVTNLLPAPVQTIQAPSVALAWHATAHVNNDCNGFAGVMDDLYSPKTAHVVWTNQSGSWTPGYTMATVKLDVTWDDSKESVHEKWSVSRSANCSPFATKTPTLTSTPLPSATPTSTTVPPTVTNTQVPPTPTNTEEPPTATNTYVPPTVTEVTPTPTQPTATPTTTPTVTPTPPTSAPTLPPPPPGCDDSRQVLVLFASLDGKPVDHVLGSIKLSNGPNADQKAETVPQNNKNKPHGFSVEYPVPMKGVDKTGKTVFVTVDSVDLIDNDLYNHNNVVVLGTDVDGHQWGSHGGGCVDLIVYLFLGSKPPETPPAPPTNNNSNPPCGPCGNTAHCLLTEGFFVQANYHYIGLVNGEPVTFENLQEAEKSGLKWGGTECSLCLENFSRKDAVFFTWGSSNWNTALKIAELLGQKHGDGTLMLTYQDLAWAEQVNAAWHAAGTPSAGIWFYLVDLK